VWQYNVILARAASDALDLDKRPSADRTARTATYPREADDPSIFVYFMVDHMQIVTDRNTSTASVRTRFTGIPMIRLRWENMHASQTKMLPHKHGVGYERENLASLLLSVCSFLDYYFQSYI
jgi:hypothetical protein